MSATNEKNRGEMAPVPNIVHNEQQQQRAEDTHELVLFGAYFDVLTELELNFLVYHYNESLPMGRSISILDIKHFPIAEITSFIKSINVGSIGQTVIDCIQAKMAYKNFSS